jgi:hypothetical protein
MRSYGPVPYDTNSEKIQEKRETAMMDPQWLVLGLLTCGLWTGCVPRSASQGRAAESGVGNWACSQDPVELAAYQSLRRQVESGQHVRIIVRLSIPPASNPEDEVLELTIKQAQEAVLERLEGTEFSVTARFETVPQLGLVVSLAAFDALIQSSHVRCIAADQLSAPL